MPHRRFLVFNIIGDSLWGVFVVLVGYFVGSRIPNIDRYILLIVAFAVLASVGPTVWHVIRLHLRKRQAGEDSDGNEG